MGDVRPRGITSAQAGRHTFALAHDAGDTSDNVPHGDGFGIATVATNGLVRASATLADGTKVSQGIRLSNDGVWPLYGLPYRGKGSISGEIRFSDSASSDLASSSVAWIKPPAPPDARYKSGSRTTVSLAGSKYVRPAANGARIFLDASGGIGLLHLEDGGLPASLDSIFQFSTSNKFIAEPPNANHLAITLTAINGIFRGTVKPDTNPAIRFSGVIVTRENAGRGFFLSKSSSGSVALTVRDP